MCNILKDYTISNKKILTRIKLKWKTRSRKRSRKRSPSIIFKWKTFHGHRYTSKLPSKVIPESPQNTQIDPSTSSCQSRVQKLQFSRHRTIIISRANKRENLPSSLFSGQCDQWSFILIETSVLNELMNQVLFFLECKRNFNRKQFLKKVWW